MSMKLAKGERRLSFLRVKKLFTISFLASLVLFPQLLFFEKGLALQASLVEESNHFKIFSGSNFNIIITKNEGPKISFQTSQGEQFQLNFDLISEYKGSSVFDSEENLFGKLYSLLQMEWLSSGTSSTQKVCVNLTRTGLANEAFIIVSTSVFNEETTIGNYVVSALSQAFIEMRIGNWSFSEGAKGITLNLQSFLASSDNYQRLGPYLEFEPDAFTVEIVSENGDKFLINYRPQITIITNTGEFEPAETYTFATYNVASYEQEPANFWVSFPYRSNVFQIIFQLICSFWFEETNKSEGISIGLFFISFATMILVIKIIYSQRKRRKLKKIINKPRGE